MSDSLKVFDAVGTLDLTLGAVDNFIVKAVSYAKYSNSTWPFVTIPDFAVKLPNSSVALPPFIATCIHLYPRTNVQRGSSTLF
jgi:hypothetical protein